MPGSGFGGSDPMVEDMDLEIRQLNQMTKDLEQKHKELSDKFEYYTQMQQFNS